MCTECRMPLIKGWVCDNQSSFESRECCLRGSLWTRNCLGIVFSHWFQRATTALLQGNRATFLADSRTWQCWSCGTGFPGMREENVRGHRGVNQSSPKPLRMGSVWQSEFLCWILMMSYEVTLMWKEKPQGIRKAWAMGPALRKAAGWKQAAGLPGAVGAFVIPQVPDDSFVATGLPF